MSTPSRSEHVEAMHFMHMVRLHESRFPGLRNLFAVPNGGDRNRVVAAKMKGEGVRSGVPDYLLLVPSPEYHGLAIELKAMGGYASKEQKDWIARLRENGYRAEVCRGAAAAWLVVCDYLVIPAPRQMP